MPDLRTIFFNLVLVLTVVIPTELGAFLAGRYLARQNLLYTPPLPITDVRYSEEVPDYDEYLRQRDPILGWPAPSELGHSRYSDVYASDGSRPSPAHPGISRPSCISLYGDSFVRGSEVSDADAWGNVLSQLMGCRVANFGVPGYGTDQALLRYQRNGADHASGTVILGFMAENIMRNLTRNRDLYAGVQRRGLKPRFYLSEEGRLVYVPMPILTRDEYLHSLRVEKPLLRMEHENFQPGGPAGVAALRFPYSLSLISSLWSFRVRAALRGQPYWMPFYEKNHPLKGVPLTVEIFNRAKTEAAARGAKMLIVLFAMKDDLRYFSEKNRWPYQALIDELTARKIDFLNFGEELMAESRRGTPTPELFANGGHYSPRGNRRLAEVVKNRLLVGSF